MRALGNQKSSPASPCRPELTVPPGCAMHVWERKPGEPFPDSYGTTGARLLAL